MPISITQKSEGNKVILEISGRFEFDAHREFRNAYREQDPGSHFVLDLAETDYMDSSALGMLLLLREHAGCDKARLSVINTTPPIRRLLEVARFDRFFDIT